MRSYRQRTRPWLMKLCFASPAFMQSRRRSAGNLRRTAWKRRTFSAPIVDAFKARLEARLPQLPDRRNLAEAMRYALARWRGLTRFLHDCRIALDTNPVERAIRPIVLGRKNHLFVGNDGEAHGGQLFVASSRPASSTASNYVYLKDVLERMADGYPVNRLDELLPWAWRAKDYVKS